MECDLRHRGLKRDDRADHRRRLNVVQSACTARGLPAPFSSVAISTDGVTTHRDVFLIIPAFNQGNAIYDVTALQGTAFNVAL